MNDLAPPLDFDLTSAPPAAAESAVDRHERELETLRAQMSRLVRCFEGRLDKVVFKLDELTRASSDRDQITERRLTANEAEMKRLHDQHQNLLTANTAILQVFGRSLADLSVAGARVVNWNVAVAFMSLLTLGLVVVVALK